MKTDGLNRREFLTRTAVAGACATGFGASLLGAEEPLEPKIVSRTLGRSGLKIPVISFGVMNSDNPDLLRRALDLGVTHFDTAHGYLRGNSEKVIGRVLEERGQRDRVFVGTKMKFARDGANHVFRTEGSAREPGATEENLFKQLDISLGRLRSDYVDILYLHNCSGPKMITFEPLMNAMVKAREAGKARFLGVSTHRDEANVIRAAVDAEIYDVVLTAYNFMQDHRDEVRAANAYAADHGVGIVAMKTQGGRRVNQNSDIEVNHRAALKWVFSDPNVCTAIPGVTTFDQLDLDFSVMADLELTDGERRELKLASMLPGPVFCQGCGSCLPSCPARVEVPELMRAYMYAEGYGNLYEASNTLAVLAANRGIDVCRSCQACTASCTRGIDIGSRVAKLARIELRGC
jgi:predicted aldo/keto reductase-like oxidoreductase